MLDQFNFLVCKSWPFVFPYGKFLVVRKQPPLTWFWITDPTPVNSCAALTGQALLRVSLLQLRVFHSTSSMFWFFNCSIGMMTVSPMWLTPKPHPHFQDDASLCMDVYVIGWSKQGGQYPHLLLDKTNIFFQIYLFICSLNIYWMPIECQFQC